MIAVSSG